MKKNAGFTLMELMISIAIVATLSAIAVPNMIVWRNNMQFNASVRMVKSAIEGVRMHAIKSNMPARLDFTDGGDTFDIVKWDPVANAFGAAETFELPTGAFIATTNFTGDQLQFNSRGMPDNALGGTLRLENDAGLCRRVVVANVGSSRIDECP
ncbi:MAG: prepilin-type N-terminal cleavage/methylation domain-containing protein [Desulfobacteraceae bacterium]|nr:MAG: prepilin-type N-terminal cleavage/methylation domain-containing protein [Desulfobacteraceae bacterium]